MHVDPVCNERRDIDVYQTGNVWRYDNGMSARRVEAGNSDTHSFQREGLLKIDD
jgi:hypothetical protein